jgi:hypothetical protein
MTNKVKESLENPAKNPSPHNEQAKEQQRKAEQKEVAGRHKNDGQKDHKGAR